MQCVTSPLRSNRIRSVTRCVLNEEKVSSWGRQQAEGKDGRVFDDCFLKYIKHFMVTCCFTLNAPVRKIITRYNINKLESHFHYYLTLSYESTDILYKITYPNTIQTVTPSSRLQRQNDSWKITISYSMYNNRRELRTISTIEMTMYRFFC